MAGLLPGHTSAAAQTQKSSACYVNILVIVITFEMKLIYYSVTFAKLIQLTMLHSFIAGLLKKLKR